MTNEEAVSILEKMWAEVEYYEETEALDMAIDALQDTRGKANYVVAEIKVDTDEIMERLEQEWYKPNEWIPCSERLPENGHYYLWCSDMGSVQSDYYWNGFENGMKYGYNIVAWMPLPEPYKDGDIE